MPKNGLQKKCANSNCKNPNCPFPHFEIKENDIKQLQSQPKRSTGAIPYRKDTFLQLTDITRNEKIKERFQENNVNIRVEKEMLRTCLRCNHLFVLSIEELQWFRAKNYKLPKRCKECREVR